MIASMENTAIASSNPSTRVQWMWSLSANPFLESHSPKWCPYSDLDNLIIERSFKTDETHATLDDYRIDLKHNLQISNNDVKKQRPVIRMVCSRQGKRLQEERFICNPVAPIRPYGGRYGFISPFIKAVAKDLNLQKNQLPSKNTAIVPMVVEKAALGIIEKANSCGRQCQGKCIADMLMEKKDAGMEEVWMCCARLYTMGGFLCSTINETMRSIGSEEHEQVWRGKVRTLGPFCLLLWDNPFDSKAIKPGTILYRGVQLSDDTIAQFKDESTKHDKPPRSFQSFTSCTRNPEVTEAFGNVLFIMNVDLAFTVDLQPYSNFPDEEEELLFPGVCFTIDRVTFDKNTKRPLIYFTLQQKHNSADRSELEQCTEQPKSMTIIHNYLPLALLAIFVVLYGLSVFLLISRIFPPSFDAIIMALLIVILDLVLPIVPVGVLSYCLTVFVVNRFLPAYPHDRHLDNLDDDGFLAPLRPRPVRRPVSRDGFDADWDDE